MTGMTPERLDTIQDLFDHPENGSCRRYDDPDCTCGRFTEQLREGR